MTPPALRAWRQAQGWTQADLARLLGLAPNTVARIERGELPVVTTTALLLHLLQEPANVRRVEAWLAQQDTARG